MDLGFWAEENDNELSYLPPPPESLETGPSVAAPGDDYLYTPGTWVYTTSRACGVRAPGCTPAGLM